MNDLAAAYDRYGAGLYRHAVALTGRREDAEDALQTVFVKLARRLRDGAEIRDLGAYLHTAVRREALRSRPRRTVPLEEPDLVVARNGRSPRDAERLNAALRRLPAEQREVVVLHVWEGMTFRAIGDVLGVSMDTAASRYRYARQKLERWLRVE